MGTDGAGRTEKPLAGTIICCTSVVPEIRTRLAEYALLMGAEHKLDLTSDVTHLLVGDADTAKYKYVAKERDDVKVLRPEWVEAVRKHWMEDKPVDLDALHEEYRLPTFSGLKICITGFDDLTFRAKLQRNVVENGGEYTGDLTKDVTHLVAAKPEGKKYEYGTQWQKKVVSLSWYKDSLSRGMQLDERLYHPTLPIDEQGLGAWNKQPVPTVQLGKRARDETVAPEPARKLRRTASERFSSQQDTLWPDIVGGAGFQVTEQERPLLRATTSLPTLQQGASSGTLNHQHNSESRGTEAPASGYLSGHSFVLYGFDSKRASHARSILESCGGFVFDRVSEVSESQIADVQLPIMLVPHQIPTERLPTQFKGDVVSEFWLEWCMSNKAFMAPTDYFLGNLVSQTNPQGFSKLVISATGFAPIQTLQIAKLVRLMGGTYSEAFKPNGSVLICKEGSASAQKLEHAKLWKLPAVNEKWLSICMRENRVPSYNNHRVLTPAPEESLLPAHHNHESRGKTSPVRKKAEQTRVYNTNRAQKSTGNMEPCRTSSAVDRPSGHDVPKDGPLKEISANSPTRRHPIPTDSEKNSVSGAFDGTGSGPGGREVTGNENEKENSKTTDPDLNGAIRDLLETKARSKSVKTTSTEDEPKKKRLFGRALSNLSNSSAKSNPRRSRASSVDSVNTDGVGSEIGSMATDKDRSTTFRGRAQSGLASGTVPAIDLGDPGFYQTGQAEEADAPVLTQLVYDDPEEAIMLREKLAQRRRQRSQSGRKDDATPSVPQQETRRIQDDDMMANAGWGAGRRTRQKDKSPPGLKGF